MVQHSTAQLPSFAGPLYAQVAGILRAKICALEWTARAPLPNEVTLARDIGVSIGTVRKALEMLEGERLIQRRQGRGTFVVETSDETEMERFSNLFANGRKVRSTPGVWSLVTGEATREDAQALMIPLCAPVYRLEAVWSSGEAIAVWDRVVVAQALMPELERHLTDAGQFLFPVYRRHYQIVVSKVQERVSAVSALSDVAEKLKIPKDRAVLQINRIAFAMSGAPVEWSRRMTHLSRADYMVTMT